MKRVALTAVLLSACQSTVPPSANTAAPLPTMQAQATAGQWVSGTYYSSYGARFYRLWVPAGHAGSARPLMVMLHGCQQDGYDFAAGTKMNALADARNFLVLYPEQGTVYNASDCWNWYSVANQIRGGEPAVITGMVDWVKSNYRVNAGKVAVAGLSAGASMANIMGCTYPDVFGGVASVAGLAYGAATTSVGSVNAMLYGSGYSPDSMGQSCYDEMSTRKHVMPTLVFQGTADSVVNPANASQVLGQWAQTNDLASDGLDNNNIKATADATTSATTCRSYTRSDYKNSATGSVVMQKYLISGMGHAWPGGSSSGTYADPCGPDASTIIANFFGF